MMLANRGWNELGGTWGGGGRDEVDIDGRPSFFSREKHAAGDGNSAAGTERQIVF